MTSPNPRSISNAIFAQAPHAYNKHSISSLTAAWGQFIAHDLIMTFAHFPAEFIDVPIAACELHDVACLGGRNLSISRNAYDTNSGINSPRVPLNDATGYLDASTVRPPQPSPAKHNSGVGNPPRGAPRAPNLQPILAIVVLAGVRAG